MNSLRRVPLLVVLAGALVVVGVFSATNKSANPSQLPSALALSGRAESTALYCTGFTSTKVGAPARVIFLNTTAKAHRVSIDDVSNLGLSESTSVTLRPYQQYGFDPNTEIGGDYFGVGAQVSGGGVVGVEVAKDHTSEAPCISTGVTNWFASGFDTTVGSSAVLSVYNPTATPAVFNVSTFSQSGYVAPAKFQGYAVGPHSQAEINLGTQIVDLQNIGVHVKVLHGALDIVGLQQSGATVSIDAGVSEPSTSATFPLVTTANGATAQLRFANPGPKPINVTLAVSLAPYHVPNQTLTLAPYGSAVATITPNSAIPAASYASVTMTSSAPVVATLATGSGDHVALSAPPSSQPEYLVGDFTGGGFDTAALTNTSAHPISLTFATLPDSRTAQLRGAVVHLAGNVTESFATAVPSLTALRGVLMIVKASRPSLLVTLTLPTKPAGMTVVSGLDGR